MASTDSPKIKEMELKWYLHKEKGIEGMINNSQKVWLYLVGWGNTIFMKMKKMIYTTVTWALNFWF